MHTPHYPEVARAGFKIKTGLKPVENAGGLRGGRFRPTFHPEHEMGARHFLLHGPLGRHPLPNLFGGPAARGEALLLRGGGTGGAEYFFKLVPGGGFEQQRYDHESHLNLFPPPQSDLSQPSFTDARVKDGLELAAGDRVGKNQAGQGLAVQDAAGGQHTRAKDILDFGEGGLAALNEPAGDFIRVHNPRAETGKAGGHGGFTHPHTAGQTAQFHRSVQGPTTAR